MAPGTESRCGVHRDRVRGIRIAVELIELASRQAGRRGGAGAPGPRRIRFTPSAAPLTTASYPIEYSAWPGEPHVSKDTMPCMR